MAKSKKLNSMRLLDARAISYETHQYDVGIRDAQQVAAAVGYPPAEVFKTLVAQLSSQKKPILIMLPSNTSLNLKRLAKALGVKKAALAAHADAERLTGLQVGGISALALTQKNWPIYLDRRGLAQSHLVISAGQRGLQVRVERARLVKLLGCRIIDVADDVAN